MGILVPIIELYIFLLTKPLHDFTGKEQTFIDIT
jgi:hypothetical protein